jgi:hypothetical protein
VSANGAGKQREGLSPQTLLIAAIASGVAAIVTSTFWKGGAIFTAALTPVIVSLVKEGLQRPMESEVMRRPVRRLSERRAGRPSRVYSPAGTGSRFDQPPPHYEAEPQRRFEPADRGMGPVHTYGTPRRPARRRWHVRAAIVTGVIAFAIAAIVLTVPELVFGGSVAGKGRTTIFSTSATKSSSTKKKSEQNKTSTDQNGKSQTDTNEQNPPAQQPQGGQTTSTPEQQSPPSQTTPGGTPPPQQAPAPSTPPTGTTP